MYEQTYTHTHSQKEKRPLDILHAFINLIHSISH